MRKAFRSPGWLPAACGCATVALLLLPAALGQEGAGPHSGHIHPASDPAQGSFLSDLLKVYTPRRVCMFYESSVIWLHVFSDAMITVAYYSIPFALAYFVWRRRDLAYSWIFWMFAGFILSCGTTHLFGVLDIWYPLYKVDGLVKATTAALSIGTAILLWPLIPKALALPSPAQLEVTVRERTAELAAANRALRESEERLRTAELAAGVGTFDWDKEQKLIRWSPELEILYGLPAGGFAGRYENWVAGVHPDDRPAAERAFQEAMGTGTLNAEWRTVWPDGSVHWLAARGSVMKDDTRKAQRLVGVNFDITDRKKADEQLRLLSEVVESAANGIAVTDRSGRILWVNKAFTKLTGYSRGEAIGQNPRLLKSGQQSTEFYENLWATILQGNAWGGQLVNRRKDGTLYDEEMTITPVRVGGAEITHFVAIKQDITERRRAEEELKAARVSAERAKAAAEQASQAKDHFLAVLSHELRTPLTPVLATVSLLQENPHLDEDTRENLEVVRRNVELEARLIDDLLDLTRISRGKIQLDKQPVNLCTVLHRAVEVCLPDIEARKLKFEFDLGAAAPYWIEADPARLQQVFWNILRNAIKFTPLGGCVGIRCRPEGHEVVVEISDSGVGIDPEALSRIFNAFEQAERSMNRRFGGLGLGLAISKALVEMHGGTISAHSAGAGKGASFHVRIPLARRAPAGARPAAAPSQPAAAAPGKQAGRILLVEDHGDTARIMANVLTRCGYQVRSAGDFSAAIAVAQEWEFDLLVSDLGLPDRSGLELIRELRRIHPHVAAIALSGYGTEQDLAGSQRAGFDEHLVKPVNVSTLKAKVAAVLSRRA